MRLLDVLSVYMVDFLIVPQQSEEGVVGQGRVVGRVYGKGCVIVFGENGLVVQVGGIEYPMILYSDVEVIWPDLLFWSRLSKVSEADVTIGPKGGGGWILRFDSLAVSGLLNVLMKICGGTA